MIKVLAIASCNELGYFSMSEQPLKYRFIRGLTLDFLQYKHRLTQP